MKFCRGSIKIFVCKAIVLATYHLYTILVNFGYRIRQICIVSAKMAAGSGDLKVHVLRRYSRCPIGTPIFSRSGKIWIPQVTKMSMYRNNFREVYVAYMLKLDLCMDLTFIYL